MTPKLFEETINSLAEERFNGTKSKHVREVQIMKKNILMINMHMCFDKVLPEFSLITCNSVTKETGKMIFQKT